MFACLKVGLQSTGARLRPQTHTLAQAIEAGQRQRLGFLYIELGFPNGALKWDCVGWVFWAGLGRRRKNSISVKLDYMGHLGVESWDHTNLWQASFFFFFFKRLFGVEYMTS